VANKEVELDEHDTEIMEFVFDEDMIEGLCGEFDQDKVKLLMKKLDIEFPEDIFPKEEE